MALCHNQRKASTSAEDVKCIALLWKSISGRICFGYNLHCLPLLLILLICASDPPDPFRRMHTKSGKAPRDAVGEMPEIHPSIYPPFYLFDYYPGSSWYWKLFRVLLNFGKNTPMKGLQDAIRTLAMIRSRPAVSYNFSTTRKFGYYSFFAPIRFWFYYKKDRIKNSTTHQTTILRSSGWDSRIDSALTNLALKLFVNYFSYSYTLYTSYKSLLKTVCHIV